ncbi:MAG: ATP-binding cassette domain-containing protein [Kiloniellaceae bacterium]
MAATPPLIALKDARLAFGASPLFEDLSLTLSSGERACLVGRNGTGKSSLLKIIAGLQDLDGGERFLQPGTKVSYLPQDPRFVSEDTVADYVTHDPRGGPDAPRHAVDAVLVRLDLDGGRKLGGLSGGEGRRVALARCLVSDPEVLLLDEPTNHLDLPTIGWLEGELKRFRGALLVISHDRTFLANLTNTTLWLDRGRLHRLDKAFGAFDAWSEELRQLESEAQHKLGRQIVREERWLQRGVTARRKRNQGRLSRLQGLRREHAEWLGQIGTAKLVTASSGRSGDMVVEAEGLEKIFGGTADQGDGDRVVILKGFSTRIRRGDRLGIIGPNGAGKSTLVKILIGQLAPDGGKLRIGANVQPLYFDQRRESLDPEATLWQVLAPDGGDTLIVRGRQRHVVSYLKDFLFDESQARQPVKALSGGEKARLLLARLFAKPSNLLVLDEPTNDLDMETLDLLQDVLDDYEGSLILVSHDRDFLDRLVTSVIAMESGGGTVEVAGGYSDYQHYLATRDPGRVPNGRGTGKSGSGKARGTADTPRQASKLSYKDQRELNSLPGQIDRIAAEVAKLEERLADPAFYSRDPQGFAEVTRTLERQRRDLHGAEERWLDLEAAREALESGRLGKGELTS